MKDIKEKLKALWVDKRPWKIRLSLAAFSVFACVFSFILFGPCEIYIRNMQEMPFPFTAMFWTLLFVGVLLFGILLGILLLLRGKIFNYAVSILFVLMLAGYLQGNFWGSHTGTLDGNATNWLNNQASMIWNLVLWSCILIAVLLVMFVSRKIWAQAIKFISMMIIGVQLIAFIALLMETGPKRIWEAGLGDKFISRGGIYEVSPKQNVIIFLLDRLDVQYMDAELALHPDWWDRLSGFTYYHNFTGSYANTRPAITYFLTGVRHDYCVRWEDYFARAWSEPEYFLLPDIHDAGYRIGFYTDVSCVFGEVEDVEGFVDNIGRADLNIDYIKLLKRVMELSVYRYSPEVFRPFFQIYTGDLTDIVSADSENPENDIFTINDVIFWRNYRERGLSVNENSQGMFLFYHLDGAHTPFYMNVDAQEDPNGTTLDAQMTGNMEMIFQYIDELKEKGLYDATTIIFLADHGRTPGQAGDMSDVCDSRVSTLIVKPAGAEEGGPMQVSNKQICQDNLRASIASYFGLDTTSYGRTIESIGEEEPMIRYQWIRGERGEIWDMLFTFKITGDANDFDNWELVEEMQMIYPDW